MLPDIPNRSTGRSFGDVSGSQALAESCLILVLPINSKALHHALRKGKSAPQRYPTAHLFNSEIVFAPVHLAPKDPTEASVVWSLK